MRRLTIFFLCVFLVGNHDIFAQTNYSTYEEYFEKINPTSFKEAEDEFSKAVVLNPNDIVAYNKMGSRIALDDGDQAMPFFQKAIEINPHDTDAYNNIGSMYARSLNGEEKAISYYKKAIEMNPLNPDAYINLGSILSAKRQYEQAIDYFKKAISINPDLAYAHYNLGFLYHSLGQEVEATQSFEKAKVIYERKGLDRWVRMTETVLFSVNNKEIKN